jgi:protocatechuate 3,4-dioxygenase beta subunit
VTGTVQDRFGNPIQGALVSALNPLEVPEGGAIPDTTDRRDRTATDGGFRVRQAGPGYLVQICTPEPGAAYACKEAARGVAFMPTYVGPAGVTDSWVTQTSLFTPASTDRALGAITVKPQAYVAGRLTHAAFQYVEVQRLNGTAAWHGETDADGDYRFAGLAPGSYRIASGGNGSGYLPFVSPVFELSPREHATVDGTLRRGANIHGVLTTHGKPVAFTDVLARLDGEGVAAVTTDAAGRYRINGLAPGDYEVGILYEGTPFVQHGVTVQVPAATSSVDAPISVHRGATLTVSFRQDGAAAKRARDELRDSHGRAVQGLRNQNGRATYTGLASGTYTVVGGTETGWAKRAFTVQAGKKYDGGVLRLRKPTLTLRGETSPNAVVEAFSGNLCPPDGPYEGGSFHRFDKADASGHYAITGLVPGRYMVGADGWPDNYAPRCVSHVWITEDRTYDLVLPAGGSVHGRLVYAATGTPVILPLSYELFYGPPSAVNPTGEHPARSQTHLNTGEFSIIGLSSADVEGQLAREADLDQINDARYFVLFPFQDGTPYYLTSARSPITVTEGADLDLGDIGLTLHG